MRVIRNQSEADYNAMEGLRSSIISIIDRKTLAHAKAKMSKWGVSSKSMKLGIACHDFLLRPDVFKEKYKILGEDGPKTTTKEGCITFGEHQAIINISRQIYSNPTTAKIFENVTDTELSLQWDEGRVMCKARVDLVSKIGDTVILVDLKTSRSAEKREFEKSCVSYGYIIQSAHYLAGAKACGLIDANNNNFLHLVIESEDPYLSAVYCLDDASLELGEKKRQAAIDSYRKASEAGIWPGYSEMIETIAAPHWYFEQNGDFADGI